MRIWQHIYFLFCLVAVDLMTIRILRKLLQDFLRSKKNKKVVNRIYRSQSFKSRVTLDYIYPLLRRNQTAFQRYHKLYLIILITAIPQYLVIAFLYILFSEQALLSIFIFGGSKIIVYLFVRANFDANMVSIFRR